MGDDKTFDRWFVAAFAVLLIVLCAAYIAAITFFQIPEKNIRFADTTLGFLLGTVLAAVVSTFFSGTKEADRAQRALATIATGQTPPPAAPAPVDPVKP